MPQFLKSLTGSFIGKVLGALFIAICFALGVGPDKWANFMIQNLPIWITPNVARGLFLGFGLLTLLAVFRPWEWRKSQRLAPAGSVQLPQALSVGHGVSGNILEAKRDTKMHEALAYIESGSWGKKYYEYIATPNSKLQGKGKVAHYPATSSARR